MILHVNALVSPGNSEEDVHWSFFLLEFVESCIFILFDIHCVEGF